MLCCLRSGEDWEEKSRHLATTRWGEAEEAEEVADQAKSLYRGFTGTLAVGQDVANLLAKHLLQDVRIPICNSGKLVWDLQGSRPYADLCTAARSEKRGLTGTPLLDKAKVTVKHLPEHLQLQRSKLESLLLGCQVQIRKLPGVTTKGMITEVRHDRAS